MKTRMPMLVTAIMLATASLASAQSANPICAKQKKITCAEWCEKYRPGEPRCFAVGPNSCEFKPQKNDTCVGDRPPKK